MQSVKEHEHCVHCKLHLIVQEYSVHDETKGGNEYLTDRFCFVFDINCAPLIIGPGVEGADYEVFDIGHTLLEQVHTHDVTYYKLAQPLPVLAIHVQAIEAPQEQGET